MSVDSLECLVLEILFFSSFFYLSSLDVDSCGGGEITELFTSENQAMMMMVKTLWSGEDRDRRTVGPSSRGRRERFSFKFTREIENLFLRIEGSNNSRASCVKIEEARR